MPLEYMQVGFDANRQAIASEYTPTSDVQVRGVWVRLSRHFAELWNTLVHGTVGNSTSEITFKILGTTTSAGENVPDNSNEIFTTTVSWDEAPQLWPYDDTKDYFIPFGSAIELSSGAQYWFALDMGHSLPATSMRWYMDSDKTLSTATEWATMDKNNDWINPSSSWQSWGTYGLWMNVTEFDADARGQRYHVVINGTGYMTPDNLHSAIESTTVPFTGKLGSGQQEWSDLNYPFSAASWDNWIGGIGVDRRAERDNGYTIGTGIDTRVRNQIILQPAVWETSSGSVRPRSNTDSFHETIEFPLSRNGVWYNKWAVPIQMPGSAVSTKFIRIALARNWGAPWDGLRISLQTDGTGEPSGTYVTDSGAANLVYTFSESDLNEMMTWWEWNLEVDRDVGSDLYVSAGTSETIWLVIEAHNWPADGSHADGLTPFVRLRATSGDAVDQSAGLDPDEYDGWASYGSDLPQAYGTQAATWFDATFDRDGDNEDITWAFHYNMKGGGLNSQVTDFVYWPEEDIFFCVAGKLYYWTEGTEKWEGYWTEVDTKGEGNGSHSDFVKAAIFDGDLYISRGSGGAIQVLTSWVDPSGGANQTSDVTDTIQGTRFLVANGFLWTDPTSTTIKKWNGVEWSAAISVGTEDYDVTGLVLFQEQVHVAKEDGIWYIDDNDLSHQRIDYSDQASQHNGKGIVNYGELLYFNVENSYWRWTGATIDFKGPYDGFGSVPANWTGTIVDTTKVGKHLYTALWASTAGTSQVLAFNGIGWHPIWAPYNTSGNKISAVYWTPGTASGAGSVTDGGRLWFGEESLPHFLELPNRTDNTNEWEGKIFNQYGWVELPWVDYGLREVSKFFKSVKVQVENFGSQFEDNITIRVGAYIQDDTNHETFHHLGDFPAGTGRIEARLPENLSGKALKVLVAMESKGSTSSTDDFASNVTPVIRAITIDGILRAPQTYSHSAQVLLGDDILDMYGKRITSRTAQDMWRELQNFEASKTPLRVEFPWSGFKGFVSSLSARTILYDEDGESPDGRWERVASVTFVEAKDSGET